MARRPVVVDGSNLATEGRSLPSLAQLDEAVRAYLAENPDDEVIVVVDASFGYRIEEPERKMFEEAEEAGELVSPPAGALGRGDGFLLRIADRVDACVLSNDSFQEFHGEYPWLFDTGRLVGGKPVPGVGWIFTPRTPVRGPKSRMAVRDAKRTRKPARSEPVVEAIAEATAEAMEPQTTTAVKKNRRTRGGPRITDPEAINEPLPFITFIAEHPLGTEIEGEVDAFTSHGAFVLAGGARCYVPVSGLGDPPPRTAKAVLRRGDIRRFVVQALDPPRRGIELALPGLARVAGAPTEETVEAEIDAGARGARAEDGESDAPRRRSRRRRAPAPAEVAAPDDAGGEAPPVAAAVVAATPVEPVEPAAADEVAAATADEAPARPRARRRPAKKAAEPAPAVTAVADDVPAATPDDAEAPVPARARRRSAKKAAAAPVPSPEQPAEPEVAAEAPAKPTRRRAAKKAAPEPTGEPPAVATEPGPPEPPPPAPVRRGRAKKAAAAPPSPAEEAPAAPVRRSRAKKATAAVPAAEEKAPAAPARRGRAKKAAAAPPPPAEEAPAAPVRRSRAKKAAAAGAPAAPAGEGTSEPVKTPRVRRSTKKSAG